MPCLCGQKVERAQPKVQCAKCNEFFHIRCVGILPADLDFLISSDKSFFCNVCAADRRKTIRSPPPPVTDGVTTISNVEKANGSDTLNLKSTDSLNQRDNTSEITNKQQVTLESLYSLIVSLRSENARVHNLISAMREDNCKLVLKTENLHSDLLCMRRSLLERDNVISFLTTEVNNLRSYIIAAMEKFGSDNAAITEVTAANRTSPPSSSISHAALSSSIAANDLPSASNAWSSAALHSPDEVSAPTVVVSSASLSPTTAVNADGGVTVTAAICSMQPTQTYAKISAPTGVVSAAAILPTTGVSAEISTLASSNPSTSRSLHLPAAAVSNARWTTVKKKRNKKQLRVLGTNTCNDLDVAVKHKWLHLASFAPSVSEDNIKNYVSKHTGLNKNTLSCYKLIKKDVSLASVKSVNFKLGVPETSYDKLLNAEIWPTNVTVKQFRFFPKDSQQPPPA